MNAFNATKGEIFNGLGPPRQFWSQLDRATKKKWGLMSHLSTFLWRCIPTKQNHEPHFIGTQLLEKVKWWNLDPIFYYVNDHEQFETKCAVMIQKNRIITPN